MDRALSIVLGALASLLFGLFICLTDFGTFHGSVYIGSVAAVWEYSWAFVFGGGIVTSIAIHRYGGIDTAHVHHLPLSSLQSVASSRPPQSQWLSRVEFEAECSRGITVRNSRDFAKRAILLLLVDSTEVAGCREWFVENAMLWKFFREFRDMDLVNLVRLLWKDGKFDQETRRDCTLAAASRLSKDLAKALCVALTAEHPQDGWIESNLKRHRENGAETVALEIELAADIHLKLWYVPGTIAECRLCGYRLPKKHRVLAFAQYIFHQVARYTRRCGICRNRAVGLLPFERPAAEPLKKDAKTTDVLDSGAGIAAESSNSDKKPAAPGGLSKDKEKMPNVPDDGAGTSASDQKEPLDNIV
ncbi:hypothetical protein PSACC_02332 [Paramicrosporidium saccamoebae]|uniref:Uncharacterized protein n=1 Tax=Paramicrosporidium saccamoebae TaxID=1246581 RepID=A0A2H9TJC1_9FUNG|nr:hypothetical protein PSACC_02332 [Paramicrosporidium saccamoebae]